MKDLHNGNLKRPGKEIEEHTRRCKDLPGSCIIRVNIGVNGHLRKINRHVQRNPHQNSNGILHRNWETNLKFHMETQKTRIDKTLLKYHHLRFQIILQSYNNENSLYWHKNRGIDQWTRIGNLFISPPDF